MNFKGIYDQSKKANKGKTIALHILANLVQYSIHILPRNLNFLDKIHHVEAFSNKFWCAGVNFKGIYEGSKNTHKGKTIALRIFAKLVQYWIYILWNNLNFLDKIHQVEAFSKEFICLGVNFKGIYERSKNAHEGKTIALHILPNLVQYWMYILWSNLNFLDKIHHVEPFTNKFWCLGVKFKGIYEGSKNTHEGKSLAMRILENLAWYLM